MDFAIGFKALRKFLTRFYSTRLAELSTLEDRFNTNERNDRLFGGTDGTRSERAKIVYALNEMALATAQVSFNELCMGVQPKTPEQAGTGQEVLDRLQRIEEKLDRGREEDRQEAAQILEALDQNRIEQGEATDIMVDLQEWAAAVQETGLPPNAEVRAALEQLSQHSGNAYHYLQLALPIIPGILSYNVELGSQHTFDLKTIWQRIRRSGRRAKGKGTESTPEPLLGAGQRWAVLAGVDEYDDEANYGRLHVCVKDVTGLYAQLLTGGFEPDRIHLLTDETSALPTRANLLQSLQSVASATEPDDLLLFYYSGHGDEQDGASYLVARDGRRLVLGDTAVPLARVRDIIEAAPARGKVIVLDACHSGARIGSKGPQPMSPEFIRRVFEEAEGLAVLASCKRGQLSYEWRAQERSVFTHYLLEALSGAADRDAKGFVTVEDTTRHVVNGVKLWASRNKVTQTPTLQAEVVGDIILTRVAGH